MLTFDAEKHHYFWNKVRVPGISEIIKTVGLGRDYAGVDTFYRDRGIAVHKCIEFYLNGTLDELTVDPVCVPYLDAFKEWAFYKDVLMLNTEKMLYSVEYNFAGTLDLIAHDWIYDYKCSKNPDPVSEIQGSAQRILAGEYSNRNHPFSVLQLPGNGPAKEIHYEAGPELWFATLELFHWKTKGKYDPRRPEVRKVLGTLARSGRALVPSGERSD